MWDEASLGSDGLIGRCSLPLPLVELMGMPPGTHIQHVADLRLPQSIKPCGRLVFTIAFEPTPATVRAQYSQHSAQLGGILSQPPTFTHALPHSLASVSSTPRRFHTSLAPRLLHICPLR
jgi:hypothetical protein